MVVRRGSTVLIIRALVEFPHISHLIPIINVTLRYFKQKEEKENKRKKKTNVSDDETSEMAMNFGKVLFLLLDSRIMLLSTQGFCVDFSGSALLTDNIEEERSSLEFNFAR